MFAHLAPSLDDFDTSDSLIPETLSEFDIPSWMEAASVSLDDAGRVRLDGFSL